MNENEIGGLVVDCAVGVPMRLGPGLLETVYETIPSYELHNRGFRSDFIVDNRVSLALKSVDPVAKGHQKQLLTDLRRSGGKVGYLLNFGEVLMKGGISRIMNGKRG